MDTYSICKVSCNVVERFKDRWSQIILAEAFKRKEFTDNPQRLRCCTTSILKRVVDFRYVVEDPFTVPVIVLGQYMPVGETCGLYTIESLLYRVAYSHGRVCSGSI